MAVWLSMLARKDEAGAWEPGPTFPQGIGQEVWDGECTLLLVFGSIAKVQMLGNGVCLPLKVNIRPADVLGLLLPRAGAKQEMEKVGLIRRRITKHLGEFEWVVRPNLFLGVLREIIAGEERWDLEAVKENLEVIDAVADRAGRAALLPRRGNVAEEVFAVDVLDMLLLHQRRERRDSQPVSGEGLYRFVLCCLFYVLGGAIREQTLGRVGFRLRYWCGRRRRRRRRRRRSDHRLSELKGGPL
jgi:hypothetical protein